MLRRRRSGNDHQWDELTTVARGPLAGPFDFHRREVIPGRLTPMATYAFDGVVATSAAFDLTDVLLTVQYSEFKDCRFVQKRRPASDGTWGQGSLGRRISAYRGCTFKGVRFRARAGFTVGLARFERCTFLRCDFGEHFSFCADYIDCTFSGKVKKAVFYGRAPGGHGCDGKTNVFEGNDFADATLGDVGFRGGVNAAAQRWPEGLDPTPLMSA